MIVRSGAESLPARGSVYGIFGVGKGAYGPAPDSSYGILLPLATGEIIFQSQ